MLSFALEETLTLQKEVATVFGKKTGDRRTIPLSDVAYHILLSKHSVRQTVQSLKESLSSAIPQGRRSLSIHCEAHSNAL